ncbi:MAG TPA: 4Fe-4S dicluster domain-containing protein [Candidatus Baltobacteraceae bacterium]
MANGFFTDTTLCIGCKACEVACKQWNELPSDGFEFSGNSYDNTLQLSGTTWRHVSFVEQMEVDRGGTLTDRWLMMSDVCKHCTHAGCMEACPTGAIVRNEFGDVYIQPDVCNGCGYCVVSCPFGVVDLIGNKGGDHQGYNYANIDKGRREDDATAMQANGGVAGKCTLCYDRQRDGLVPACAKACPTESIQFGDVDELKERAKARVESLQERGVGAYLYGVDSDSSVGDLNAFFLLTERPEAYNLPARPVLPSTHQPASYTSAALAAAALALVGAAIFRSAR